MASTLTFLNAVNAVLKRVGVIQGSTGELTSFTDAGHQREVDIAIQLWNDAIRGVYELGAFQGEIASATFVGVVNTREYSLPTNFERMAGRDFLTRVVKSATREQVLYEYPGGYEQMYVDQAMATKFSGAPVRWAINPVTNQIRFDTENSATDRATSTYNFLFEKTVRFTSTNTGTATGDYFPFGDQVVDALTVVVAQYHDATMKGKFDGLQFKLSLSQAVSQVTQTQPMLRWGVRYGK